MYNFSIQAHLLNGKNVEKNIHILHQSLQSQILAEFRKAAKMSKVGWV